MRARTFRGWHWTYRNWSHASGTKMEPAARPSLTKAAPAALVRRRLEGNNLFLQRFHHVCECISHDCHAGGVLAKLFGNDFIECVGGRVVIGEIGQAVLPDA